MAGTLSRPLRTYCTKHRAPVIDAEAGQRKHELAEVHRPQDPKFRVVVSCHHLRWAVAGVGGETQRPEPIIEVQHRRKWPYVKHYYYRRIYPERGTLPLPLCGYPPFGTQVILNGHE
jgi:hypothetical protein